MILYKLGSIHFCAFIVLQVQRRKRNRQDVQMVSEKHEINATEQIRHKKHRSMTSAEVRKVPVPPHRYSPLKEHWTKIVFPVVKQLHLQIRYFYVSVSNFFA